MRIMIAMLMLLTATQLWAQESTQVERTKRSSSGRALSPPPTNPFDEPAQAMDYGMGDMMDGMGGMDGMDDMGMDEGMMGGMGGGMGMGGAPDPETKFRRGLQRAIEMLKKSKDESNKELIRGHIRTAFDERYDRMIAQRKKDVERLRKSITKLESDLERRTAAKKRVVELQLQSVQLAAEGLLEINDPQPSTNDPFGGAPGFGGGKGGGAPGGGGMF